jgi:hypothetical protein
VVPRFLTLDEPTRVATRTRARKADLAQAPGVVGVVEEESGHGGRRPVGLLRDPMALLHHTHTHPPYSVSGAPHAGVGGGGAEGGHGPSRA